MTDVKDLVKKVNELEAELQRQREALTAELKPRFHDIFKPFLEKHTQVSQLSFTAYTPYFNDGDTCEYSVNEIDGWLGTEDEDAYEGDLNRYGPSFADLLDFKRTGVPNKRIKEVVDYYTKPGSRYSHEKRGYVEEPAKYANHTDAARVAYRKELTHTEAELEELAVLEKDWKEVKATFQSIPEEVIEGMFGDHVRVTITREGVEVDDYDHD